MQGLSINVGENPPAVTVTALALIHSFSTADEDRGGDAFKTFAAIVMHAANPERNTLDKMFCEVGLRAPATELATFFESGELTPNAKAAITLLSNEDNAEGSSFAEFLAVARKQFA